METLNIIETLGYIISNDLSSISKHITSILNLITLRMSFKSELNNRIITYQDLILKDLSNSEFFKQYKKEIDTLYRNNSIKQEKLNLTLEQFSKDLILSTKEKNSKMEDLRFMIINLKEEIEREEKK